MSWFIAHSAKGTTWKNHKYIRKENGRYIYPKKTSDSNATKASKSDATKASKSDATKVSKSDATKVNQSSLDKHKKWESTKDKYFYPEGYTKGRHDNRINKSTKTPYNRIRMTSNQERKLDTIKTSGRRKTSTKSWETSANDRSERLRQLEKTLKPGQSTTALFKPEERDYGQTRIRDTKTGKLNRKGQRLKTKINIAGQQLNLSRKALSNEMSKTFDKVKNVVVGKKKKKKK